MLDKDLLATCDATRELVKIVIGRVRVSCGQADFKNAADSMGILSPGKFALPGDVRTSRMVYELAMFESDGRGSRPLDRFLRWPVRALPEHEQDLARRLSKAVFSLFRITGRHEAGGI